jgi:hypothetical protein
MEPSKIKVSELENYIRKTLPINLQNDLKKLKMVKEADLECCAYFISTITMGENSFRKEPYAEKILPYNVKGIYIPLGKKNDVQQKEWRTHRKNICLK